MYPGKWVVTISWPRYILHIRICIYDMLYAYSVYNVCIYIYVYHIFVQCIYITMAYTVAIDLRNIQELFIAYRKSEPTFLGSSHILSLLILSCFCCELIVISMVWTLSSFSKLLSVCAELSERSIYIPNDIRLHPHIFCQITFQNSHFLCLKSSLSCLVWLYLAECQHLPI